MTRKAARRKHDTPLVPARPSRPRGASPWIAMGAVVATVIVSGTPATASELGAIATGRAPTAVRPAHAPDANDPRSSVIGEILRRSRAADRAAAADPRAALQDPAARRFDIPPGPLATVLAAFERVSGIATVLSIELLGAIQSPGVTGTLTPEQALTAILEGTGVAFRMTAPNTATLELRRLTESVDVSARVSPLVSSPKYSQPLRDIPQTIQVIQRETLESQGVTTLSEAMRNVPGITLQAGEGGGASNTAGDMFNLRGFNAANGLFVDGVRDDGLVSRDVYNLEQIEVFMGPTGSDVGRSTAAGYVNMETKTPHLPERYAAQFAYGTADQKRLTVDANRPLRRGGPDGWLQRAAVRFNALWQDSGVPGRDIVEVESRAIAPSIALGLDTKTRVVAAAQVLRQENVPDYGIPGAAWLEAPLTPATVRAARPVRQENYYGSVGYDYDRARQETYTARVEHDVSTRFTLRNQTRYNETRREAVITTIQNVAAFNADNGLVTVARQGNERQNAIASNQTGAIGRFSTGSLRHATSLGVEYTHERQFAPALGGIGARGQVDIFTPNPHDPVTGYAVARTGASTLGSSDTVAVYGFDTIDLNRRWQVTGGVRWERYDVKFRAVDAAGAATTDARASDAIVSAKAGVLHRFNDAGNVYVSYGTTVLPPGGANFTLSTQVNNQNNPNVEPQKSTNYEVGSKWDFASGRLSLNTAAFRTVNTNVIFTVDATAVPPIYNQDDGQRVNGVSIGMVGRPREPWQVQLSFAYLDTALDSQNAANDGNRLTLTPECSGSVWTTYRLPSRVTIGGGVRATGAVFINAANTIQSPGYALVDGLVEYEVNAHLTLRVNVYNATNETYIRNVNNNGGRYNPGNPRSVLVTSAIRF